MPKGSLNHIMCVHCGAYIRISIVLVLTALRFVLVYRDEAQSPSFNMD